MLIDRTTLCDEVNKIVSENDKRTYEHEPVNRSSRVGGDALPQPRYGDEGLEVNGTVLHRCLLDWHQRSHSPRSPT